MFTPAQATDREYLNAFVLPPQESELQFYRDFDYAVDWCVEQFGKAGSRWRVYGRQIEFANPQDAEQFGRTWAKSYIEP